MSDLRFTDEDLKRFKEDLGGLSDGQSFDSEGFYSKETMQALIARLQLAEDAILHHANGNCECNKKWRESCGKNQTE